MSKEIGNVRAMMLWRMHALLVCVEIPVIIIRILS